MSNVRGRKLPSVRRAINEVIETVGNHSVPHTVKVILRDHVPRAVKVTASAGLGSNDGRLERKNLARGPDEPAVAASLRPLEESIEEIEFGAIQLRFFHAQVEHVRLIQDYRRN